MDTFLMNNRPMGPKDWGFDVAVTAAAFLFGCVQLMLAASSIVIPDLALRQYLGMVNVVPNVQVFVALAVTTLPLVVRRRFPWPVFLFCLVSFLGLQNAFNGFSLTIVGPVVALYTIASERGRVETVAAVLLAVAGLLFTDAHAATANMVLFTRFQNIVLAVAAGLAGYAYRTHRAYVKATEDRAAEAERHARERAQAHLPDDLLLVLADVLLHRYPERHSRRPLCRQPGRVQLPEVDRCGDDDRAAGDGGYGGRDLRAALLLPDGQAERDRSPHDQEAAEERDAAGDESDDV